MFTLVGVALSALFLVAAGAAIAADAGPPRGHGEVTITTDIFDQLERVDVTSPVLDGIGPGAGDRSLRKGDPIGRW